MSRNKIAFFIGSSVGVLFILFFFSLPCFAMTANRKEINDILKLTNLERKQQTLKPLTLNPKLTTAAQLKANDMIKNKYFAHVSPAGKSITYFADKAKYHYEFVGENLSLNYTSATSVMFAWLNSPTHKANILDKDYKEVGFAIQKPYIVEVFGKRETF